MYCLYRLRKKILNFNNNLSIYSIVKCFECALFSKQNQYYGSRIYSINQRISMKFKIDVYWLKILFEKGKKSLISTIDKCFFGWIEEWKRNLKKGKLCVTFYFRQWLGSQSKRKKHVNPVHGWTLQNGCMP